MNTATDYVVMKLISGEQILAAVTAEFDDSIVIAFPLLLKNIPAIRNGMVYEKIATVEFCSFTDEKEFNIYRKDIIFVKRMKKNVALMYQRSLEEMYLMPNHSNLQLDPEPIQESQFEESQKESTDTPIEIDPEISKKYH